MPDLTVAGHPISRRLADRWPRRISKSALLRSQPGRLERGALARGHAIDREFLDRLIEKPEKIELCGEVQKHTAEPDRRAVHEHEFARHPHRPFFLERPMNPEGLAPAVFGRLHAVRDGTRAVVE